MIHRKLHEAEKPEAELAEAEARSCSRPSEWHMIKGSREAWKKKNKISLEFHSQSCS